MYMAILWNATPVCDGGHLYIKSLRLVHLSLFSCYATVSIAGYNRTTRQQLEVPVLLLLLQHHIFILRLLFCEWIDGGVVCGSYRQRWRPFIAFEIIQNAVWLCIDKREGYRLHV
jgi:hypothetical protein